MKRHPRGASLSAMTLVASYAGEGFEKFPPVALAAASPASRVAAESTVGGVSYGLWGFVYGAHPGAIHVRVGFTPPDRGYFLSLVGTPMGTEVVRLPVPGRRPLLVRQITTKAIGLPPAMEWWLRRVDSSLPLTLVLWNAPGSVPAIIANLAVADRLVAFVCDRRVQNRETYTPLHLPDCAAALSEVRDLVLWEDTPAGVTGVSVVGELPQLEHLYLRGIDEPLGPGTFAAGPAPSRVAAVVLVACPHQLDVDFLRATPQLRSLMLCRCEAIADLAALADCPEMRQLSLLRCDAAEALDVLAELPALRYLALRTTTFPGFSILPTCSYLTRVLISGESARFATLADLARAAPFVSDLALVRTSLSSLQGLGECKHLARLTLTGNHQLADLEGCEGAVSLEEIHLTRCEGLIALGGLRGCPALAVVSAVLCMSLISVRGLAVCPALRSVSLISCMTLVSLRGLGAAPLLEAVRIHRCGPEIDVAGLTGAPRLAILDIFPLPTTVHGLDAVTRTCPNLSVTQHPEDLPE